MRILLISSNLCREPYAVYPLGISVVAGALAEAGHTVTQYDIAVHGLEHLPETLRGFAPDAVGIGIRNLDTVDSQADSKDLLDAPAAVISSIREHAPGTPVILGGSGFSLLPEVLMRKFGADYGIAGEGENAMPALIRLLEQGKRPAEQVFYGTPPSRQAAPLYSEDLLDHYANTTHILPVQTKRGCPLGCVYCTYPALEGREIRMRDPRETVDQLEQLAQRHPDCMIHFVDAVFNDPARNYHHLLEEMNRRSLSIPFAAFLTPLNTTDQDLDLLCSRGMIMAEMGIDGTTDETLRGLGKGFRFTEAETVCRALRKRGVAVTANVMFGGPGETWDTVRRGIQNLISLAPVPSLIFSGIRLFPTAPLTAQAERRGLLPDQWDGSQEHYYYAPGIDPERLHGELTAGFSGHSHCIYPPQKYGDKLRTLHRFGYLKYRNLTKGART